MRAETGDFKGSIDGAEETDKSDAWGRYAYRTTSHYRREITPELVSARNAATGIRAEVSSADGREFLGMLAERTDDLPFVKRIYGRASPRWSTSPLQEDHAHGFCLSICVSRTPMMCGQLNVI